MSGPVILLTSRTRADWALYGPSSGKPSDLPRIVVDFDQPSVEGVTRG